MRRLLLLISIIAFTSGCAEAEKIKLTLVLDKPIDNGNYPAYFKDIVMPFSVEECSLDYLLKPINVTRLDIGKAEKETNAWFFENTGDNTVEFSKGWLDHYFTDSLAMDYLVRPPKREAMAIDSYLKEGESNVFIYSEDAEVDEYNGFPIYTSSKDVNNAIKSNACTNTSKEVIVLINPSVLKTVAPPPPIVEYKGFTETPNKEAKIVGDPCTQSSVVDGLDLKDNLLKIIDTKRSYKERDKIAKETWAKYFDEMASVKMYLKTDQKYPDFWESGDGANYLIDRLAFKSSITDINILRIERHRETGKISAIVTIECHNASEVL